MTKIFSILLFLSCLLLAFSAEGQDLGEERLAAAILRLKTGERGTMDWRECGSRLSREEAITRSNEYASHFYEEHAADANFDPWVGASIAMQESSFNRCAISRPARLVLEERLDHPPTEDEIVRLLRSRPYRTRMGVGAFDAGLVQFRWPGAVASLVGVTDAAVLVNARTSIRMLAASMQHYRRECETVAVYRGVHTVNRADGRVRVVNYAIPCADGYWVQHNSPHSFSYRYYTNVMRWHADLQRLAASPVPEEEDPS